MVKIISFLGNPGAQYARTRHNAGWLLADELSAKYKLAWQQKFKGSTAQLSISGNSVNFIKPETFMNKCGESVGAIMRFFKATPEELLVVHDELEFDFGQIGFKKGGGLAGHNGLRSITENLGTREFYRFRLGISRPSRGSVTSHVLNAFSADEQLVLPTLLEKASEALEFCLRESIENAISGWSKTSVI
ncbi:aminoacyl-tRNA hydrolase [candidate division KSB1 bacterium]|nr:aminoacyl-tRNA hydrolase [candidate division KSB1 bacterium]